MYEVNLSELPHGPEPKRKRTSPVRDTSRRLRETLFFRMLLEGETGSADGPAAGAGAFGGYAVPAWLSVPANA